jgi:hypothetical protein
MNKLTEENGVTADKMGFKTIHGLYFKSGAIAETPKREVVRDLDSFPVPA